MEFSLPIIRRNPETLQIAHNQILAHRPGIRFSKTCEEPNAGKNEYASADWAAQVVLYDQIRI